MARYTGPKHRLCRREGIALCGSPKCPVIRRNAGPPGQHAQRGRRKTSEYGLQLRAKQRARRIYGVLERQFARYFGVASKSKGATGIALLQILESRLDNIVYRLGFASTRYGARQLVSHGHVLVDGKKVNIPSFNLKPGQIVTVTDKAAGFAPVVRSLDLVKDTPLPDWLAKQGLSGQIKKMPARDEITEEIDEQLIVEYYSR